jgi:RHS repeat-associated protein
VTVGWRASAFAYGFEPLADTMTTWYGTVVEGKEDASGLVFHRNRYVDAQTGRFTQEDPIGLGGGINQYGYGDGDPINFSDPFGLCAEVGGGGEDASGGDSTKPKKTATARYCSNTQKLTVTDEDGNTTEYDVGNNVLNPSGNPQEKDSYGPFPEGIYTVGQPVQPNASDQGTGSFGSWFYPVGGSGTIAGKRHTGIHGGRRDYRSQTKGCLRMNNGDIQAMQQRFNLTQITVLRTCR